MKAEKAKQAIEKWEMPDRPKEDQIDKRTIGLLKQAAAITAITSEDHYLAAGAIIPRIDEALKWIDAVSSPFVQAFDRLHKQAVAFKKRKLQPLVEHKARLLSLRMAWATAREREQAARQQKAAAALQATQKKELESAAREALKSGDKQTAELFREQAKSVPLPALSGEPAVPKQEGLYVRERFTFEIVDEDKVPREYCSPDSSKIRKVVEAMGFQSVIPGVVVRREVKEHSRAVPA